MNLKHATPELFAALAKAQAEVENATKGSSNPHFKSRYADLAEVLNTVRPVFARNGLCIMQSTRYTGQCVEVATVIGHSAGGYVRSVANCVPAKTDAQGIGAATTYLRRYALAAATGIAQEDDDGNAAAHDRKPESGKGEAWLHAVWHATEATIDTVRADIIADFGGADAVPPVLRKAIIARRKELGTP